MRFLQSIEIIPYETALNFTAVFEEQVDFRRVYTLPFNTLVGVTNDGETQEESSIEDCNTHEKWIRRKGYLYFTPCGQPVLYTTHSALRYIAVHFNLELCPGIDVFAGMKNWIIEHSPGEVAALTKAFHIPDRLHSLSCIREICLRFCNRHWPEHYDGDYLRQRRFEKVLTYVRTHATAETTVRELATMMNLRQETFSHEFSEVFRKPPKDFLQNELAAKAASLLMHREYNVKEVAALLDFSSEYYFSKFFKRQIGCAPSEYRKRMLWHP